MATIFTRIINGEIPCYKIAEDEHFFAFLDINPIAKGHTLVVPKKEIDYIFHQDDATLAGLLVFAKKVGLALEQVVPCARICLSVIGLEVPHTHVHLIPSNQLSDLNFKNRATVSQEEMAEIARKVAALVK
jgi:histidine triad (HIT) family protein